MQTVSKDEKGKLMFHAKYFAAMLTRKSLFFSSLIIKRMNRLISSLANIA